MKPERSARRVVGVDVGGSRKGFHAVALENGAYLGRLQSCSVRDLAKWIRETVCARVVAIDAPCRWSPGKGGRAAERQLLDAGIRCFLTPTRGAAVRHASGYYEWMLRGAALFRALRTTHPLSSGIPPRRGNCCFETFPHAITWHLRGGKADASRKRAQRLALLRGHGCDVRWLTNMDWIDAALCALAAETVAAGRQTSIYGDRRAGHIIVPSRATKIDDGCPLRDNPRRRGGRPKA